MPKMKTNSGAAKRFKITGKGKIKRSHAYKRHILTCKNQNRKRQLRKAGLVDKSDLHRIRQLLGV